MGRDDGEEKIFTHQTVVLLLLFLVVMREEMRDKIKQDI
jgi:hypothetical protein